MMDLYANRGVRQVSYIYSVIAEVEHRIVYVICACLLKKNVLGALTSRPAYTRYSRIHTFRGLKQVQLLSELKSESRTLGKPLNTELAEAEVPLTLASFRHCKARTKRRVLRFFGIV
jgi:hypothetical protein